MEATEVQRIEVNNVNLVVRDEGTGDPAIVFVHYWEDHRLRGSW